LIHRLEGIFKAYKNHYPGCKVVYIFPYRPAKIHGIETTGLTGMYLDHKISSMRNKLSMLSSLDRMIDLTYHFRETVDYSDSGTGIPEPTKKGARKLANLIFKTVKSFHTLTLKSRNL